MRCLLLSLVVTLTAAGLVITALSGRRDQGPVYSVAQVQAGLARQPAAWVGRTLLVRGVAGATLCAVPGTGTLCGIPWYGLRDPELAATPDWLDVTLGPGDSLLAVLRRMPLVGAILPTPQVLHWEAVATYRVRLRAVANARCGAGLCYEALLLDAVR